MANRPVEEEKEAGRDSKRRRKWNEKKKKMEIKDKEENPINKGGKKVLSSKQDTF